MSGYVPGWEIPPLAAAVSVYFYLFNRKFFKMAPAHAAMFSVLMTVIFGWGMLVLTMTGATSYRDGVAALVFFTVISLPFISLLLHFYHVLYVIFEGRTLGRFFNDADIRAAALRGKGLRARLRAADEARMKEFRDYGEWKKVRREHFRDILLNRFDDTVVEVSAETAGGR